MTYSCCGGPRFIRPFLIQRASFTKHLFNRLNCSYLVPTIYCLIASLELNTQLFKNCETEKLCLTLCVLLLQTDQLPNEITPQHSEKHYTFRHKTAHQADEGRAFGSASKRILCAVTAL